MVPSFLISLSTAWPPLSETRCWRCRRRRGSRKTRADIVQRSPHPQLVASIINHHLASVVDDVEQRFAARARPDIRTDAMQSWRHAVPSVCMAQRCVLPIKNTRPPCPRHGLQTIGKADAPESVMHKPGDWPRSLLPGQLRRR
jgi:hypothetical protein